MLGLAEEWRQRFGQSADFHGAFISNCDLVGGTCLGVATYALQSVDFDLCVVDEASKAAPTEILVPMAKSKKWIVVGDPNQLPPFADESKEARAELTHNELTMDQIKRTLLDHFIDTVPASNKVSLSTQHRMTKAIGDLVSECFYQGLLKNVNTTTCKWLAKALALPAPVTWIDTAKLTERSEKWHRGTWVNPAEVDAVADLLVRLELAASKRGAPYTVVLLSGYGGQIAAFERMLASKKRTLPNLQIEAATVDSYQGREADIAVYSVTRSNSEGRIGFLRERERLNVALSRAKLGLAIVGDSVFCGGVRGENPFADVLSYMRANPDSCVFVER
jgi:superfamily I DNA and/or RNA helicase